MMTRNSKAEPFKRVALFATVAALAVTMSQTSMAAPAATQTKAPVGVTAKSGISGVTDFSSQRRRYARRGGGNGGAAAAAAIAGIVGTAIIASQADRGYGYGYGDRPYESYAYSPGYDGGGPGYYGGGGYYGGRSTGYFNGNGGVPLFKGRPLASW